MRLALVSTYELGHQPLAVASPAAALRAAGHTVRCLDLAVQHWDPALLDWADALAFSVPMHTAMRLALSAAEEARARRHDLPIAFYGLYAAVGRPAAPDSVADVVLDGEFEPALLAWAASLEAPTDRSTGAGLPAGGAAGPTAQRHLGRSDFRPPARDLLPPLRRYARLEVAGGQRVVGAIETTHGCRHQCRHCPIPVVYGGRLAVVPLDVLLADVEALVAAGAEHLTFADADFLNAPAHARRVVDAVHGAWPQLSWDATVKVEHILRHGDLWPRLAAQGCLFVVSAFESTDDRVLARLDKGHTAADAITSIGLLRSAGIDVRPSWLPFTPWTRPADVLDILGFVVDHDLVPNVDPVQYAVRLLLPQGSLLLADPDVQRALGPYDPDRLSYTWASPHPEVDALQREVAALVEADAHAGAPTGTTFLRVWAAAAAAAAGAAAPAPPPAALAAGSVEGRPRMTEPWFC